VGWQGCDGDREPGPWMYIYVCIIWNWLGGGNGDICVCVSEGIRIFLRGAGDHLWLAKLRLIVLKQGDEWINSKRCLDNNSIAFLYRRGYRLVCVSEHLANKAVQVCIVLSRKRKGLQWSRIASFCAVDVCAFASSHVPNLVFSLKEPDSLW